MATLFFFNPALNGFYPQCFFHQLTGLQCPGCGGLRAVHQLLHGQLLTALRFNALAVLALPSAVAWWWHQRSHGKVSFRIAWLWIGFGVLLGFAILRNLPGFGWLSP